MPSSACHSAPVLVVLGRGLLGLLTLALFRCALVASALPSGGVLGTSELALFVPLSRLGCWEP